MGRVSLVSKYKLEDLLGSLTEKQRSFCLHYIETNNATESAKRAGYSKKIAHVQGCKLLKNKKVADVIGEVQRRMLEENLITVNEVMEQLSFLVTRDPIDLIGPDGYVETDLSKIPRHMRCCIDGIKQTTTYDRDGNPEVKTEIKMSPKATAIDMALKVFGMYQEQKEEKQTNGIDWEAFWKRLQEPDPIEQKLLEVELPKEKPEDG